MASACAASSDYRTRARRIRARLAGQPAAMHRALAELGQHPTTTVTRVSPPADSSAPVELFAQWVSERIDGPLLRYSVRQELLEMADRLGIHRFEANLIIATIQHRRRHLVQSEAPAPLRRRWPRLLTAAAVQSAILLVAWALLA